MVAGRLDRKAVTMLYNALSDLEIKTQKRRDLIGRFAHSVARTMIKKLILPLRDPTVRKVVHGVELFLPLSHDLPRYVEQYPYYDTVLPNLAKFLLENEGLHRKLFFVDVGANVGDTTRLVSAMIGRENAYFICVEADEIYLPLFYQNTEGLSVALHNVIAASRTEDLNAAFARDNRGTSSIVHGSERRRALALDDLTAGEAIDVIKIDTDGYEAEVLSGLRLTLEHADPLLFLEYSPRHLIRFGKIEPKLLLEMLRGLGYGYGLIYDHRGYPMGFTEFTDQAIRNLVTYCLSAPGFYADLLLAKERNVLVRFYDWDIPRYLGTRTL
jgi:FkbM family methyltransferase